MNDEKIDDAPTVAMSLHVTPEMRKWFVTERKRMGLKSWALMNRLAEAYAERDKEATSWPG